MNAHTPMEFQPPLPPHSIESEQQLIGAVLMANDAWFPCADLVEAEHFYEPAHEHLWKIISDKIGDGQQITPVTLIALLGADGTSKLGHLTVGEYVRLLASEAATIKHAPAHAKVIRNLWARRKLVSLSRTLQAEAMGSGGIDVEALMEEADQELAAIRFGKQVAGVSSIGDLAERALKQTADAFERDASVGFTTGVQLIDEMIGPIMSGEFVTILAPSGHGKSAIGAQILNYNGRPSLDAHREAPGLMISMEMEGIQVARRQMATDSGITTRAQKTGGLVQADYENLRDVTARLKNLPFFIDQSGRQKTSTIIKKLRALKRTHGIRLAVIDHLKLIRPESPRWDKFQTIEYAAQELKDAAKELDMAIIMLAQVTRESQKRDNWKVQASDLWGGEVVKECSDVFLTVCLPFRWLNENEPSEGKDKAKWLADCEKWKGYGEIAAPKVRDGEVCSPRMVPFNGARMLFSDKP